MEIKYFWKEFGQRIRVKNLKVEGWKIDDTLEIGNWNEQKTRRSGDDIESKFR